jgi:hypothetical protein
MAKRVRAAGGAAAGQLAELLVARLVSGEELEFKEVMWPLFCGISMKRGRLGYLKKLIWLKKISFLGQIGDGEGTQV